MPTAFASRTSPSSDHGSSDVRDARRLGGGLAAAFALAGLVGCAGGTPAADTDPEEAAASRDPVPTASDTDYADGTYEATGWYGSLPSHQDVTLTIEGDVVTDVTVTTPAEDPTSLGHQERFADAIGEEIIGRDLDDIAIDRLAGASGCSKGFMNALAEIKAGAQA
ncbi:uncharacterized protein with FMN-binding domain [Microbacterium sp. ZKA21]|jgi:uncharacterized protein with FMN-binding domain|uniref:hypothetical protein n=1 Tax=Microbacterium sp. ZKA21 TaxID=3381694 RepID=UPI003D22321A